jgi:hypothetical protein
MLTKTIGTVKKITSKRSGAVEMIVEIGDSEARAIAYTDLVASPFEGEQVLLNTTAVELGLGTGGYHFVIENLFRPTEAHPGEGHIMRLRYTPYQKSVLTVEEQGSPYRDAIERFESLEKMPVIVGQLHSQLAPAAAAVKRLSFKRAKVAYIMTDSASLPIAFSRSVEELKSAGIIDATITYGQAFGGDFEAVNIYSALQAARQVAGADVAIVIQGPGNVGTGTKYGFTGLEMGEIINAVNVLGGQAVAIPRISFADERSRHRGISHHTVTALMNIALTPALITLPMLDDAKLLSIQGQLDRSGLSGKHRVRIYQGGPGIMELIEQNIKMSTMGRSYEQDPDFFLAAAASGAGAVELLKSGR